MKLPDFPLLTDENLDPDAVAHLRQLDFGRLAILQKEPVIGIVYLRPGHIDSRFTLATIRAILGADPDVDPPFILVAKRAGNRVTLRIRRLTP